MTAETELSEGLYWVQFKRGVWDVAKRAPSWRGYGFEWYGTGNGWPATPLVIGPRIEPPDTRIEPPDTRKSVRIVYKDGSAITSFAADLAAATAHRDTARTYASVESAELCEPVESVSYAMAAERIDCGSFVYFDSEGKARLALGPIRPAARAVDAIEEGEQAIYDLNTGHLRKSKP